MGVKILLWLYMRSHKIQPFMECDIYFWIPLDLEGKLFIYSAEICIWGNSLKQENIFLTYIFYLFFFFLAIKTSKSDFQ